jgi:hypothetical protein
MKRLLLLAAGLALGFAAAAQQYKWVDQNGRTQYGDNPPPGVKATRLQGSAGPSAPSGDSQSANKPMSASDQETAFRKRQEEAAAAAAKDDKTARAAADKKDACERSQDYLRTLESGVRISRTDASGERTYMDDDQRTAETNKARAMVKQNCG